MEDHPRWYLKNIMFAGTINQKIKSIINSTKSYIKFSKTINWKCVFITQLRVLNKLLTLLII